MGMVTNLKDRISDFYASTDTLVRYYNDIRPYKVMTIEEEREAFYLVQNGNTSEKKEARDKIINCNQRFVIAMAKKYASCDKKSLLDFIEAANLGLMEAIDCFDMKKNVKFTSFAVWYVRRAINKYKASYGTVVKRTNISKTNHLISQIKHKFIQQEQRSPTSEEIVEILNKKYGTNLTNIADVFDVQSIPIVNSVEDEDEIENAQYVKASMVHNEINRSIDIEWAKYTASKLLNKLPTRESNILKMSFGIGYDRQYEIDEIATQIGLTSERVRQLRLLALQKLKDIASGNKIYPE